MGFGPNIQGIRVTGSLSGITSIHTTTISATTLYGDGSNLTGISSSSDNFYVTGATMNGNTLDLSRSGGLSDVTVDLSQFDGGGGSSDGVVTGSTLNGSVLELGRTQGLSTLSTDLSLHWFEENGLRSRSMSECQRFFLQTRN